MVGLTFTEGVYGIEEWMVEDVGRRELFLVFLDDWRARPQDSGIGEGGELEWGAF